MRLQWLGALLVLASLGLLGLSSCREEPPAPRMWTCGPTVCHRFDCPPGDRCQPQRLAVCRFTENRPYCYTTLKACREACREDIFDPGGECREYTVEAILAEDPDPGIVAR